MPSFSLARHKRLSSAPTIKRLLFSLDVFTTDLSAPRPPPTRCGTGGPTVSTRASDSPFVRPSPTDRPIPEMPRSGSGRWPETPVKRLVKDGQRSVKVVLEVRNQPGHGIATPPFEQVNTQPLRRDVEPEALADMKIDSFDFYHAAAVVPWEAPQPEGFAGRKELFNEVVQIGDTAVETERDRHSERTCAAFGQFLPPKGAPLGSFYKTTVSIHHPPDDLLMKAEVATARDETTVMADELCDRTEVLIVYVEAHMALRDIGLESVSKGLQYPTRGAAAYP